MKRIFFIVISAVLFSFAPPPSPLADKIIDFSMANFGKKIDRGECWDLASAALNAAGADWHAPYDFGDKVAVEQTQRADILQFTNIKILFSNGSMSFPQHTAIVYKSTGKRITLIHQNFNTKRYVDTITINIGDIKNGKIEAYRPRVKK